LTGKGTGLCWSCVSCSHSSLILLLVFTNNWLLSFYQSLGWSSASMFTLRFYLG
jgi:hypothetical protein